jgi:gamma-glutamylcyclotransferase
MPTLYFGYGSNLWLDQMARRCPESRYVGISVLRDWKWFICGRGYANVIPSPGDIVYGMIYEITAQDEAKLDGYENVPEAYAKQTHVVEMEGKTVEALVNVDMVRVTEGEIKAEYIVRMKKAIQDGLAKGIPKEYVDKYMRRWIM